MLIKLFKYKHKWLILVFIPSPPTEKMYWFEQRGYVLTNSTPIETNPVLADKYIAGMVVTFIVDTGGNIMALGTSTLTR